MIELSASAFLARSEQTVGRCSQSVSSSTAFRGHLGRDCVNLGRKEGSGGEKRKLGETKEIDTYPWLSHEERGTPVRWAMYPSTATRLGELRKFLRLQFRRAYIRAYKQMPVPCQRRRKLSNSLALHPPLPSTLAHFTK